jgi:urease accessory protein
MTALLRLLQLVDSGFPTGSYAYSHGLEGLFTGGLLAGEPDILDFARAHVEETLAQQDLPAVHLAHSAAGQNDLPALVALDRLLTVLRPVPAFRLASTRIGRQTLESAIPLYLSPFALRYREAVQTGVTPGHHPVVFGVIAAAAAIPVDQAVAGFAASALNSYVAAAVRLGVIGQASAQRIIALLHPDLDRVVARAAELGSEDLGGYMPLIDIAGMRQPALATRMFSS